MNSNSDKPLQPLLAHRAQRIKGSALREIFKAIKDPNVISFAGGLPNANSFPSISVTPNVNALQYGASEGLQQLRELVATKLSADGLETNANRVLILSGSQQGIDLMAKLCIDTGSCVAVESPTYLAALQAFMLFGASLNPFSVNCDVHDTQHLSLERANDSPNLLYTVPTFSNPTTRVYNKKERQCIANYCELNNTILFEDDPYRDICFSNCYRKPISAHMKAGSWVYQSSFSKTIAPGLRIGYLTCSENLYEKLLQLKQASDLHSCNVSQQILCEYFSANDPQNRSQQLSTLYKENRDLFEHYLHENFDHLATWKQPEGGLFFWLNMGAQPQLNTNSILHSSLKAGVAFMPGTAFYPNDEEAEKHIRLNFSHAKEEQVQRGLKLLAAQFESECT